MSVEIHYYDDEPAWKIQVPDPSRFKGVNYDLEIKLFRLPEGGLVALWLRLYDVPDQPFFLHRVLDPSDAANGAYLAAARKAGKIVLVFESPGEQDGFAVEIPVNSPGLAAVLSGARDHAACLGEAADGEKAVREFQAIFDPALKEEKSVEAAWERVRQRRPYIPPPPEPEPAATGSWFAIGKLFFGAFLCVAGSVWFKSMTPLAANASLENKVVRPGYEVRILLAGEVRAIDGRWNGRAPSFTVEGNGQSFIDSVGTHSDNWGDRLTETHKDEGGPPSFQPYIAVALKDDPALSGETLTGTASVTAVYPVFSGVAYKEMEGTWSRKVSFTVFTFPQFILARAAPLLLTVGALLGVLTIMALYGRAAAEATPGE